MVRATGPFEVKITPQAPDARPAAGFLGRLNIDKQFFGDLEARSLGQMLAFRSTTEGSAGYVALEQVTVTLAGRSGSFVLQHSGHADRGVQSLFVNVVADSGTGALAGLTGTMQIIIADRQHSYVFDYELPAP